MRILRRALLGLVLLPIILIMAGYLAFPALVSQLIERQAAAYGVVVNGLQVRRPGWRRWRVARAELVGFGYTLEVVELEVAYNWQSLLDGRATQINVLQLVAREMVSADDGEVAVGALLLQLPERIDALWRALPADRLRVDGYLLSAGAFAALGEALGELRGELSLSPTLITTQATTGEFHLSAQVEREGELLVEVADAPNVARIEAGRNSIGTASIDWSLDDGIRVLGVAPFAVESGGWRIGEGLTVVAALRDGYALDAEITVAAVRGGWEAAAESSLHASVGWQGSLVQGETRLDGAGAAELTLAGSALLAELPPGSKFTSAQLASEDLVLAGARVVLPDAVTLRLQLPDGRLTMPQAELELTAEALRWSDYTLRPRLDVTLHDLEADTAGAQVRFAADWRDVQSTAAGSARVDLESSAWTVDVELRQSLFPGLLQKALAAQDLEYGVDAGQVTAKLSVRGEGTAEYSGTGSVRIGGAAAHYAEVTASNLAGVVGLRFNQDGWRADSPSLTLGEVDVGFPVFDLRAELNAGPAMFTLTNLRGVSLGGELLVDRLHYDMVEAESEFLLQASGIQLAQVLALEGDSLTGQATLDGQLPLRLLAGEASSAGGKFSAREPGGVLRYADAQTAARSLDRTGVGFAIAALEDFQFSVLDVGVDYAANGDLLLGIRLEGFNADFENGRPIHYNLNLTENIPVLLESLRLSDEVGRRLEERLLD